MKKTLKILIVAAVAVLLGRGVYLIVKERTVIEAEVLELKKSVDAGEKENESIAGKIDFFKYPENLIKELKSQTNFIKEGEKLIIVVPEREAKETDGEAASSSTE